MDNLLADISDRRLFLLFEGERPSTLFAICARLLIPPKVVMDRWRSRWANGPMLVDDQGREHMYVLHTPPPLQDGEDCPDQDTIVAKVERPPRLIRVEVQDALRLFAYREAFVHLRGCMEAILSEFWVGSMESLGAQYVRNDLDRFHFPGFTTQTLALVTDRATNQVDLNIGSEMGPLGSVIPEERILQRTCPVLDPDTRTREWERSSANAWADQRVTTYIWGPDFCDEWCVQACVTTYVDDQMWCIGGATDSVIWHD